jgi:hypothetical protein
VTAITTGLHPKALWPGVLAWFGRAYDEYAPQYVDLVDVETSDKSYEEEVETTGFGMAGIKGQGASINYDSDSQGYTARYTHVTYGIGYMVTEEELEDDQYADVSKRRAPDLAFALRQTKENVVANKFNRAFNSSYAGGDGVELCSTAHVTINGNQSNRLATDADISEAAIEDMIIQIRTATNARGLKIRLQPQSLHIPTNLEFEAYRILNSVNQNDTANNAVNVLKATGSLPKGIKSNQYLTDTDAWFLRTNVRHGMKLFQRRGVKVAKDNDFDTSNAKVKATERYSVGWSDWRCYYGTPGV